MSKRATITRETASGFVLVTAMIFLAVLTLVAVIAVRSSGLELRMSSNLALQTEAFEASEAARRLLGPVVETVGFNYLTTGTPDFASITLPSGVTLLDLTSDSGGAADGQPDNWFAQTPLAYFDPASRRPNVTVNIAAASGAPAFRSELQIEMSHTAPVAGNDLTQGGGSSVATYLLILSEGVDSNSTLDNPTPLGTAETSAMVRFIPRPTN